MQVPYSGICSTIVGTSVWVNDTHPIEDQEVIVADSLKSIRANRGIAGETW